VRRVSGAVGVSTCALVASLVAAAHYTVIVDSRILVGALAILAMLYLQTAARIEAAAASD
jgi:hypothetical protein